MRWDRAGYGVGFFSFFLSIFQGRWEECLFEGRGVREFLNISILQTGFFLGDMGERGDLVVGNWPRPSRIC